jgi:hypothetical protein
MESFLMLMIQFSDQPTRRMYYQYASLAECAEARELYSKDRAGARIGEAAFSGKDGRLVTAVCTRGHRPKITDAQRSFDEAIAASLEQAMKKSRSINR